MDDIDRLIEMRKRWQTDKSFLRMMAHGRSIEGGLGMDELYRTAKLLNEVEFFLGEAILEASAKEN